MSEQHLLEFQRMCQTAMDAYNVGACNPLGLSKGLAEAVELAYRVGPDGMKHSKYQAPARLLAAQLAHLMGNGIGGYETESRYTIEGDLKFCKDVVDGTRMWSMERLAEYIRRHGCTAWIDGCGRLLAVDEYGFVDSTGTLVWTSRIVELEPSYSAVRCWLNY